MSIKEHPPQSETPLAGDSIHVPVLLEATLEQLHPKSGESYLDLTAGYGGHARRILELTSAYTTATLVDRDEFAHEHLSDFANKGAELLHTDFVSAACQLITAGRQYDIVLADLGVSSPQLDMSERGFSFMRSGPLDMRMDRRQELTAEVVVNTWTRDDLIRIIRDYGEESQGTARQIAEAIEAARPIKDTARLATVIAETVRYRKTKHHPATRTFQALRIAVNQELGQIAELLPLLPKLLRPSGRVGVISFHSLEDRLVKRYFHEQRDAGLEAELKVLTKKPLDGATYDVHNPRARSAKLRVAVKT